MENYKEIVIRIGQNIEIEEGKPFFPVSVTVDGQEMEKIREITVHAEVGEIPKITYTQYAIP